jgi:hypothetical protein
MLKVIKLSKEESVIRAEKMTYSQSNVKDVSPSAGGVASSSRQVSESLTENKKAHTRILHKPFILSSIYKKFVLRVKRGGVNLGEIRIRGIVDIQNGKYHQKARNHFVGAMLNELINFLSAANLGQAYFIPAYNWTYLNYGFMVLGTDTTTPTNKSMTALVVPIGTAPGTKPNSQTGSTAALANGASVTYTATWNAGTVSGTVGEIGLYLYIDNTLWTFGANGPTSQVSQFASRLSVGDGDFTAFTINTAAPLTINWTIQFTFS